MSNNINVDINSNINLILHCVKIDGTMNINMYIISYGLWMFGLFGVHTLFVAGHSMSLFIFSRQILVDTESFGTDIGCLKRVTPSPKLLKQVKQRLFLLQYQTQICLRSFIGTSLLLVDSGMLRAIFPLR